MNFSQDICHYTKHGRNKIHQNLDDRMTGEFIKMMRISPINRSNDYHDNRLSKYLAQRGKCLVTGNFLSAKEVHCHHIKPKSLGRTDHYDNLMIIQKVVHQLIHATDEKTIERYKTLLQLNQLQLKKVNKYRKKSN